ncbi:hypothetical protein [Methylocystis parvus]|uniref:hypothetical protein n=1 Tax=Methylocystis parvus TaxID=134 RepID=UPI003C7456B8
MSDSSSATFLTRAGSFVPDTGRLVNAAGYYLMGFPSGAQTEALTNMEVVRIRNDRLYATPTTQRVSANLPSGHPTIAAADLPSTNAASAKIQRKVLAHRLRQSG